MAVLDHGPLIRADAIVVLCGEDADGRMAVALQLLKSAAAPRIVLSGGLDDPPRLQGASRVRAALIDAGVHPDRLIVEPDALHTRDQAVNVVRLAMTEGWTRLLLVASPYHQYRAFLTFLKVLQEMDAEERIRLVPAPATLSWWGCPPGTDATRLDLLASEVEKITRYAEHVASFSDGLAYLKRWEGQ